MQQVLLIGHAYTEPKEANMGSSGKRMTYFGFRVSLYSKGMWYTTFYKIMCWGESFSWVLPKIEKGTKLVIGGKMSVPKCYFKDNEPRVEIPISASHIDLYEVKKQNNEDQLTMYEAERKALNEQDPG